MATDDLTRCSRCGGPPPVDGETYRHHWPCGCAVTPHVTMEPIGIPHEWVYLATGHGACGEHPTREGAIAAWRAALGPYHAPVRFELLPGSVSWAPVDLGEWAKAAGAAHAAIARFDYGEGARAIARACGVDPDAGYSVSFSDGEYRVTRTPPAALSAREVSEHINEALRHGERIGVSTASAGPVSTSTARLAMVDAHAPTARA